MCGKVDLAKAEQWAAKATQQGSSEAAELLETISKNKGSSSSKQWSKMAKQVQEEMAAAQKGMAEAEARGGPAVTARVLFSPVICVLEELDQMDWKPIPVEVHSATITLFDTVEKQHGAFTIFFV
jgi:hypothetical protein